MSKNTVIFWPSNRSFCSAAVVSFMCTFYVVLEMYLQRIYASAVHPVGPVWARGRCRISPPRFLAECCKRQLNQGSFVLLYFRLFTFLICIEFVYLYFPALFCLSVSVKWLAVKTASEMTYIVSSGALNSTPTNQNPSCGQETLCFPPVRPSVVCACVPGQRRSSTSMTSTFKLQHYRLACSVKNIYMDVYFVSRAIQEYCHCG